ncbi:MAG: beta strand repeat-containing protein [Hassallia sp.]
MRVSQGQSLLLLGGNVNLDGSNLSVGSPQGGRLELAGVAEPGTVGLNTNGNILSLNFPDNLTRGNVSLTNAATLDTRAGNGGSIAINARNIDIISGSRLLAGIRSGSGTVESQAGDVTLNATGAIRIQGQNSRVQNNVSSNATGNSGNISITSGLLSLRDGAELSASTFGQGNAGNVTVNATDAVSLADANIFSTVEAGGMGKGGNINVNAATLSLIDGAQLQTSTRQASSNTQLPGRGDAGNVNVKVSGAVDIVGSRGTVSSGIRSQVGTGTVGNGGNITIDSGSFSLQNGAAISALTRGQGNAGTIKVNAADSFTISGSSSNLNSGLFVNSQSPTGTAGDIIVTSPRATLDNGGRLSAQSASGNGGNINLQTDLLLLRRGSQISTTAGTARSSGNGGNINIDAGFIVALPQENSDISANAFSGNGGTVTINAQGIFGIQSRQQPTPQSDITASSTGGGINGVVDINTLDIDPSRGFINLPTNVVDTPSLVAQSCSAFGKGGSEFTVTGRGGLPPSPDDFLSSDVVWSDTRLTALPVEPNSRVTRSVRKTADGVAIAPATGWVFDEKKGEVTLIAEDASSEGVGSNQVKCIVP